MSKPVFRLLDFTSSSAGKSEQQRSQERLEEELRLAKRVRAGNQQALHQIFSIYYSKLCVFSNGYVKSIDASRDVVQDVFVKIWENHHEFNVTSSLKAYLYRAVRNQSINYIEKRKQLNRLQTDFEKEQKIYDKSHWTLDEKNDTENISKRIWMIVDELPERRKQVFLLHRKHGLSYKEIAKVMGIKVKTVENQMGRALDYIRTNLNL